MAGHVLVDFLQTRREAKNKIADTNERIVSLVYSAVNWFDMDKQVFFNSKGTDVPQIGLNHPVHSLVATIRNARPDLDEQATSLITSTRKYFELTRIYIPTAETAAEREERFEEMMNLSNGIIVTLTSVLNAAYTSIE